MSTDTVIDLVIITALLTYLIVALIFPGRF